jgi:GNAT superfamily N-acetyltransferase
MNQLKIEFIPETQVPPELNQHIDALDHLAFSGEDGDPDVQWAAHDWMALGWLDGELVSQLCLLKREIRIGTGRVWIAGVGGVATHPQRQKQGLASQLMRASETFMRDEIRVPFGLLVCADETRPFYEKNDWKFVADEVIFIQNDEQKKLKTCVMILLLSDQSWPPGKIDLCGLPW